MGELVQNYYAVGHVSLDNYIAQVSGQAPNLMTSSDCSSGVTALQGSLRRRHSGHADPNQAAYPGQVDGQGCVFPTGVQTIGNQLDAAYPWTHGEQLAGIRRGHGQRSRPATAGPRPLGGTDCAHPTQVNGVATDDTNNAEGPNATGTQVKSTITDQYADRHNPFIYFHSITDNQTLCDTHVVPARHRRRQLPGPGRLQRATWRTI